MSSDNSDSSTTRGPWDPKRLGKSGQVFARTAAEGRAGLVGYLPVGYPTVKDSLIAFDSLIDGRAANDDSDSTSGIGVDLIEIGMPYSDPMMDGLAIQQATDRALKRGAKLADLFTAVEHVAGRGMPNVVMIYWSLVERYGVERFARDLASAGGSGLITPDLTPDEAGEWIEASDSYDLDRIFLVAPASTDERIDRTLKACRGWVYATSVMGVTGTRSQVSNAAPSLVERIRGINSEVPIGVGLGVSSGDQARTVGQFADGVIVGSAFVKTLLNHDNDIAAGSAELGSLVTDMAVGVRRDA